MTLRREFFDALLNKRTRAILADFCCKSRKNNLLFLKLSPFFIPVKRPQTLPARIPIRFDTSGSAVELDRVRSLVRNSRVATVCESAACPNLNHCWSAGSATFMIMGERCTRRCTFCNIETARPAPLDPEEPRRVAETIGAMKLHHAVITSVDRDDLPDCGSAHFAEVIRQIRSLAGGVTIEVLIPDFKGRERNLERIWQAAPDLINHNIETVPRLYREVCPQADFDISLRLLEASAGRGFATKSGLLVGLGEEIDEVKETLTLLHGRGVRIVTIGQYLRPGPKNSEVKRWISREQFDELKAFGEALGFSHVESGPLVRSSYHAATGMEKLFE